MGSSPIAPTTMPFKIKPLVRARQWKLVRYAFASLVVAGLAAYVMWIPLTIVGLIAAGACLEEVKRMEVNPDNWFSLD